MTVDLRLTRRGMLGAAAALPVAGLAAHAADAPLKAGAAESRLDLSKPEDNAYAMAKIEGDLDGKDVFGWFSGMVYGVRGDKEVLKPLFGFEGFGANRMVAQGDNTWRKLAREVGYYKDLKTNEILEKWTNPYTNEVVDVSPVHNDPVSFTYGPTITIGFGAVDGEEKKTVPFMIPHTELGDDLYFFADANLTWPALMKPAQWPRESPGENVRVAEFQQIHVSKSALADRSLKSVKYNGAWERIATWLPWMLMGQDEGHLFYRTITRKLASIDELPRPIYDYTKAHYPDFLTAPREDTKRNVSSFEVYAREHQPKPPKIPAKP